MDIDMKKLETAILYVKRISDGHNPVNNMPVDEDSVLNNPNVIRCMYFIKDVLEEVKEKGIANKKTSKKYKEPFPVGSLSDFKYEEDKPITNLTAQINSNVDSNCRRITYKNISNWLMDNDYLEMKSFPGMEKSYKVASIKGESVGIRSVRKKRANGEEYMATYYGKEAQELIVSRIEDIINFNESTDIS